MQSANCKVQSEGTALLIAKYNQYDWNVGAIHELPVPKCAVNLIRAIRESPLRTSRQIIIWHNAGVEACHYAFFSTPINCDLKIKNPY